jgi:hypothetical protein
MLKNNCVNELEWIESKWNFTLPPTEYGEARGFSKIDSPRFKKNKQFFNGLVSHTKNQNPRLGMLLCICLAIN